MKLRRTVCYAQWANSDNWYIVADSSVDGVLIDSGWWSYARFGRFIVREEVLPSAEDWGVKFRLNASKVFKEKYSVSWTEKQIANWLKVSLHDLLVSIER